MDIVFDVNMFQSKPKKVSWNIIEQNVEGVVCITDKGKYYVRVKNRKYNITEKSYDTKGKTIVYTRFLDKHNHRIKVIRKYSDKIRLDSRFYIPFTVDSPVRGDIIRTINGIEFRINSVNHNFRNFHESTFENFKVFNSFLENDLISLCDDENINF